MVLGILRPVALVALLLLLVGNSAASSSTPCSADPNAAVCKLVFRTLSGSANNVAHPSWGQANTASPRVAAPNYGDGISTMPGGPEPRRISNRIFNDLGQNLFSENAISQWGWAWGQFVDHDVGLRDESNGAHVPMAFTATDPLERFSDTAGILSFDRTLAAPGTGEGTKLPRQQLNTLSSYIDGSQVYSTKEDRLAWLRQGADLLLPGGFLPRADARGKPTTAPPMDLFGRQVGQPTTVVEAGDVRANENVALTAIQTLFVREHNRIADSLPKTLGNDLRFQIARKVVGAEIAYITYREFLPTLGVKLDPYSGYKPGVDAAETNEFAAVGFRAHSMVHGEFEVKVAPGFYPDAVLATLATEGATIDTSEAGVVNVKIPLALAFGNPGLVQQVGLGPLLKSLGDRQYRNDEQIDDSLRSVLFQVPKPGTDPAVCGVPTVNPGCFTQIADVGADDIQRGRDHGMPFYNAMRKAYGLLPVKTFTEITGESTSAFPPGIGCDSAAALAFTSLTTETGEPVALGDPEAAVNAVRGSTLAARLKCLYGSVDKVDAFVGMVSEKHLTGIEFGPLQLAIWKKQFEAFRDGDRFFYSNDPGLVQIETAYGISYRHTLAEIVKLNTGETLAANPFRAPTTD